MCRSLSTTRARLPSSSLAMALMPFSSLADAPLRLLGRLEDGHQPALRCGPPRGVDAGVLADHAAPSVAPDEILRAQRSTVRQLDVDAGVALRETGHPEPAMDRHP